jgi:NDP-sugar pyrophosphorylase family protein/aminoglycoside/choline kinase family phosphotransferase
MHAFPINIFLPAAGLGERLRPVTNHLPKSLLPVLGKPIIEAILEKLAPLCTGKIGINLHYKPEMIRDWAKKSPWADRISFFPEDPILGTGGALKNAEAFLANSPFIVHNSDILLNIDFTRVIDEHISSGNIATLVCHRIPALSNVVIDKNGQVLDVENPGASRPDPLTTADKVAYTGIALYSPKILQFLPLGVSHATVAWIAASKAGHRVRAMDFNGSLWSDIGTPVTYARAILDALRETGESVYISSAARCGNIEIDGSIVLESESEVGNGSSIKNCIVMPGARVSGIQENRIIGPDYVLNLSESDMQPSIHAAEKKRVSLADTLFAGHFGIRPSDAVERSPSPQSEIWSDAILIGLGGSDRRYFRVRNDGKTVVLMECKSDDPDFERHIVYTRFFSNHSVPVPTLFSEDNERKHALFEDLGDMSLYSYMKLPHGNGHIENVYRSVLDILVKLHTVATDHVHECSLLQERIFDYDYFRWETNYFVDRFIIGLKKASVDVREQTRRELDHLAQESASFPRSIIHRDFQCQNIMMTKGHIPRVIDYQGARMAPPAYDLASMLWDPYHRLADSVREKLIEYYVGEIKKASTGFDETVFLKSLIPCRLQRHMQALGAYGFLSAAKGKKYFLKHVPEALRLLKEDIAEAKKEYPELCKLVNSL